MECVGVDTLTWRVVFGLVVVSVVVERVILEAARNQSRPSRLFLMLNPGHTNVKPCQRVILDGIYSHGYVSFTTDPAKGPGSPLVNTSEMFVPGFLTLREKLVQVQRFSRDIFDVPHYRAQTQSSSWSRNPLIFITGG